MKWRYRKFLKVLFLVALVGPVFFASLVWAEEDLQDKQDDLEELQEKKESYQKIINIKQNQEALLSSQIQSLNTQAQRLEGNIEKNSKELEETKGKIVTLENQVSQKEQEISKQKELLAGFLQMYYDWNSSKTRNVLFSQTENAFSLEDQSIQLQEGVSDAVEKIESIKRSLARDRETFLRTQTEIETLNAQLEQQTAYLEGTKKQKETLVVQTTQEKTQYQKKLSSVEEQIRDIEEEIQGLESDKSSNIDMSKLPSKKSANFEYPVEEVRITQRYGKTTFTRWYTFHNGVDFGIPSGTEILAVAGGKVVATGDSGKYAYGKWIVVDHGNGLATLYGHLSRHKTSRGKSVAKGDVIGLSGNTGYSTGPHLHFSVFASESFEVVDSQSVKGVKIPTGAHVNPSKYLP